MVRMSWAAAPMAGGTTGLVPPRALIEELGTIAGRVVELSGEPHLLANLELVVGAGHARVADPGLDSLVRVVRAAGAGDDTIADRSRNLKDVVVVTSDRGLRSRVPRSAGLHLLRMAPADGRSPSERYAWLSVATGVVVLGLKTLAWYLTDSRWGCCQTPSSRRSTSARPWSLCSRCVRAANRPPMPNTISGTVRPSTCQPWWRFLILAASAAIIATP